MNELRIAGAAGRVVVVMLGAMILTCLGSGVSYAFWSLSDSSNPGGAIAGSLGTPGTPTGTVSGRDINLSWSAGVNATTYTLSQSGFSSSISGSCNGTVSSTSCTDTSMPENGGSATSYTFTTTPHLYNWNGPASASSASVTVPAPAESLTTTSYTSGSAGTTNATITNFYDNEGVTFCLDQNSTPCSNQLNSGSVTVPASGGTTTLQLTIPAIGTAGSHTIYAIGSNGSLASAAITVGAGTAAAIATVAGDNQSAATGSAYATLFAAKVTDAHGNPVSGATVTFTAPSTGASGKFANNTTTTTASTDGSGVATASTFTANSTAGAYSVTASATGAGTTSFGVANSTSTASIALSPSSGATGTVVSLSGSGFNNNSTLTGVFGGTSVTISGSKTSGAGVVSGDSFTVPALPAGTYLVTITDGGPTRRSASATFTITSSLSSPSPSSAAPGASVTVTGTGFAAGSALTVTVGLLQATVTSGAASSSTGGVNAVFTMPSAAPGSYPVIVSDGTNQASTTVTVTNSFSATLAASGTSTTASVTSSSFSLAANTAYVVFVSTTSASGDGVTMSSAGLGSPTISPLGSQVTVSNSYLDAYLINNTGAATGSGTITATFAKTSSTAYLDVVKLAGNDATTPIVTSTIATKTSTTSSNPATANMTGTTSTNAELVFLAAESDTGATAPTSSSAALTNLTYAHGTKASAAVYSGAPPQATESLTMNGKKNWGTIALEVKLAGASLTSVSPSSGSAGTTVTLAGSGFTNGSTLSAQFGTHTVSVAGASWNGGGGFAGATVTVPSMASGATTLVVSDGTTEAVVSFTVL